MYLRITKCAPTTQEYCQRILWILILMRHQNYFCFSKKPINIVKMIKMYQKLLFSLFFSIFVLSTQNVVVGAGISGQIMSFIDINADLYTDLVVVTPPNFITVYVAQQESVTSQIKQAMFKEDDRFRWQKFPNGTRILNIGVGDFNGDSYPDLAVSLTLDESLTKSSVGKCGPDGIGHQVYICYSSSDGFHCVPVKNGNETGNVVIMCEQPLILDCNIDQRSDLLTTIKGRDDTIEFYCFYDNGNESGAFESKPFPSAESKPGKLIPASSPTSNAFIDVTGDLNPEIVLWTKPTGDELTGLRVFRLDEGPTWVPMPDEFMPSPTPTSRAKAPPLMNEQPNPKAKSSYLLGQSIYDDFNKDGKIDHMLPFCELNSSGDCAMLSLRVWVEKVQWDTPVLLIPLVDEKNQQWSVYQETSDGANKPTFHARSGDYTQDGYPDLIIVLEQVTDPKSDRKRAAFLLENVPCAAGEVCNVFTRSFKVWWHNPFVANEQFSGSVAAAGFFDLGEDGTLDALLEYRNSTTPTFLDFSTSVFEGDTTFLKVQVFTATCLQDCRFGREGSAISLPGAALFYSSSDTDGNKIRGAYTQRSITSYRPLLLPFVIFGLGRTPNFVEELKVGAPSWPMRNNTWVQLVPNSRLYIIPYPIDEPKKWLHRLYVTPNKLIMYSLISLSSVCGLIIIVVFALHMQERRMDKKERELQRERFHFDAM